jgi:hypothetical protein
MPPGIQIVLGSDDPSDSRTANAVQTSLIGSSRRNESLLHDRRATQCFKTIRRRFGAAISSQSAREKFKCAAKHGVLRNTMALQNVSLRHHRDITAACCLDNDDQASWELLSCRSVSDFISFDR